MTSRAKRMWCKHYQALSLEFYLMVLKGGKELSNLNKRMNNINRLVRREDEYV